MQNELLQAIDTIDESVSFAEMETVSALAETYVKSLCILEASDETTDLSSFDIFQESELYGKLERDFKASPYARRKESVLKRIILFIPRLIYKLLKISLLIINIVINILTLPIQILIGTAVGTAKAIKYEKDNEVELELDFNPEYISKGLLSLGDVVSYIEILYNDDTTATLSYSIDAFWPLISKMLPSIEKFIKDFDKEAYKKTSMGKAKAKKVIHDLKGIQRDFKKVISKMEKLSRKEMQSDKISEESKQRMSELMQVLSDWTKKNSELAKKLQEIKQDIVNEKGASVFNTKILDDAESIEAEKINDGDLDDARI